MRQVGNLGKENEARRFASYLVTKGIPAQIESDGDEWTVWVRDENQVAESRDLFETFRRDPDNSEYRSAERAAEQIRREQVQRQRQAHQHVVQMRERWSQSTSRRAPLTLTLIVLSVLVTLTSSFGKAQQGLGASVKRELSFVDQQSFEESNDKPLAAIARGEVWRLVTPIFVHYSPIHLIFNMIMFFQFAMIVETLRGTVRLGAMILAVALLSNLAQAIFPEQLGGNPFFGGMSGVVYGLFGYVWLKAITDPQSGFFMNQSTVIILVGWLLLCMTPAMPNVANVAHIIGLVTGMALGYLPSLWRG